MEKLDCKRKAGLVAALNLIFPLAVTVVLFHFLGNGCAFIASVSGWIFFQCVPFLLARVVSDGGFSFYLSSISLVSVGSYLFVRTS